MATKEKVERIREGRPCDANEIIRQIGKMNILAISGGSVAVILDSYNETIGIQLPCGANRQVEVTLNFMDTYTVRRYRTIVTGERRGEDVLEFEEDMIYCDEVAESAYRASIWR